MSGVFDELITDRTLEDVQRLTDKGVYCASDMNRVENATAYLAGLMIALPNELRAYAETLGVSWHDNYDVPYNPEDFHLTAKSDWAMEDIPDLEDSERYRGNISALCGGLGCSKEELPKSLDKLFYQDAKVLVRFTTSIFLLCFLRRNEISIRNLFTSFGSIKILRDVLSYTICVITHVPVEYYLESPVV